MKKEAPASFFVSSFPSASADDAFLGLDGLLHKFVDRRDEATLRAADDARVRLGHRVLRNEDRAAVLVRKNRRFKCINPLRYLNYLIFVKRLLRENHHF